VKERKEVEERKKSGVFFWDCSWLGLGVHIRYP
jgi:hypothetical protein